MVGARSATTPEMKMSTTIQRVSGTGRARAEDIDKYIGNRMRARRTMLGLTQQQMADVIGVTYQQAHKYEKGVNRIAGGRLYQVAQALGVDVGFFFDGVQDEQASVPTPQQ